jgi:hypothetical protein
MAAGAMQTCTSAFSIPGVVARNLLTSVSPARALPGFPERDAAARDVDMVIFQNAPRISRILGIGGAQLGPIQMSGDRARVVQPMRGLIRQARQREILRG